MYYLQKVKKNNKSLIVRFFFFAVFQSVSSVSMHYFYIYIQAIKSLKVSYLQEKNIYNIFYCHCCLIEFLNIFDEQLPNVI